MLRYIVLLLITSIICGETDYDKLVYKDGKENLGEYSKINNDIVYFKVKGRSIFYQVPINLVQTLELKSGTIIINDGNIMNNSSTEYYPESQAANHAKKDARKWLAYPILALLSSGSLTTATFFIGEDIFRLRDESILFPSIFVGSMSVVGSYNLFSKLDKKKIEVIRTEDIELYEKTYSKEYEHIKLKNIIISSSLLGLTAITVAHFAFKDFMTDYDPYFGP